MKKIAAILALGALVATSATASFAGEKTKVKLIKPTRIVKSTQAVPPVSLGLGGLGAGAGAGAIVLGTIAVVVVVAGSTSGT